MKSHRLFIILVIVIPILLLLIIVGNIHYHTPREVDTPAFPLTMTVTKVDPDGTQGSRHQITITGKKLEYPSGIECLDVEVTGLPLQRKLIPIQDTDKKITGEIQTLTFDNTVHKVLCLQSPDSNFASLLFSPDYERWAISYSTNEPFYVGSVDDKYTVEELYEYFSD